jgi:PKD repeat protein
MKKFILISVIVSIFASCEKDISACFTASSLSVNAGDVVTFKDCSKGGGFLDNSNPANWNWNFGDGYTSTGSSTSHIYLTAGTFIVTLTIKDADGDVTGTTTQTITVNNLNSNADTLLNGTWTGTWAWSGIGSNGCTFYDGGSFSMILTQTDTTFSGYTSGGGIQTRDQANGCVLVSTDSGTGTASGTISGTTLNLSFNLNSTVATLNFTGTATLNGHTLTGTFVRDTGGNGSFTITK